MYYYDKVLVIEYLRRRRGPLNFYEIIDNILRKEISNRVKVQRGEERYAIYPFGYAGMLTKQILNQRYGIKEELIVDNYLSDINSYVLKIREVEYPEKYIWIIAVADASVRRSIIETLPASISADQIINIFEKNEEENEEENAPYPKDFRALSQIGRGGTNSIPAWEVLECVKKQKRDKQRVSVAEIGVDIGATSVEICKLLDKNDQYFAFDYEEKIEALFEDLGRLQIKCILHARGNSRKIYDSYNWNLSEMLLEMEEQEKEGMFDVVYLDGNHTLMFDGLACCLLKQLLKKDGYIIFDDIDKSYDKAGLDRSSPVFERYTEEQTADCQIRRVVNIFMRNDENFREIFLSNTLVPGRVVYQRLK